MSEEANAIGEYESKVYNTRTSEHSSPMKLPYLTAFPASSLSQILKAPLLSPLAPLFFLSSVPSPASSLLFPSYKLSLPISIFHSKPLPAPLLLHSASMAPLTTSMACHLDLLPPPARLLCREGSPHLPRVLPAAGDEKALSQCYKILKKKLKSPRLLKGGL